MARVGIFPGTFDPVHEGHIAFALQALQAAGLDRVVLVPEPWPRGKQCTALAHRAAMLELAVAAHPQLSVLRATSRQFTVARTLPELQASFPQDKLALLLGSDVLRGLARWPGLAALLAQMELVAGLRASDTVTQADTLLRSLAGARFTIIESPHPHATSSVVRQGAHRQAMEPVAGYILQNQLYAAA
ncbi:MAG TPA: nicotinate-nicotinamide nucleotide adenylyltransferase [Candidatus Saccharimonadales bacterium]|nr:nicotinate-nicotinamide nucleotide adenylyltransferase [Candidatus Saccharimonadales bacterium]